VGVGWLPSAAVAIGALPVLSGFLVNMVLQATKAPGWVANLSPWSHLASVPDAPPNWAGITIFLVLGATLTGFGLYGYGQRDLAA
jgi:ABC-2 type transport system permease protein